jgi:hypothetical protein
MSWQNNRRRRRTWYRHYKAICDVIMAEISTSHSSSFDATRVALMFFDLYERMRLHKNQKTANSARLSLELAIQDTGLHTWALTPVQVLPPSGRKLPVQQQAGQDQSDQDVI